MLIRMGVNAAVHAAAGVATAGILVLAAEGWRRACKAGNGPRMAGDGRHDDDAVARHDWIDEEAESGPATGGPASGGSGSTGPAGSGPAGSGPGAAGA